MTSTPKCSSTVLQCVQGTNAAHWHLQSNHVAGCLAKHPSSRLQCSYTSDERVNRVCRQTTALPFLPADVIANEFQTLHTASNDPRVAQHLQYMERQWISSTTWPPTTWSVFRQPVWTNNDVEGWHCRLNDKASHGQLNLYKLIQLLYAEAALVQLNVRLLSEGHTMRLQRKSFAALHSCLSKYWDEYVAGTRSAHRLLRACSHLCKNM